MSRLLVKSNKYSIKLENFEGPLDLLCHLISENQMNIYDINLSKLTEQYIEYLHEMEEQNLEISSEFILMTSTLIYIKSKKILPKTTIEEDLPTEEELIDRIIEYKKIKDASEKLKERFNTDKRFYGEEHKIELPKLELEDIEYDYLKLSEIYKNIIDSNKSRINENAKNIDKIALVEHYYVVDTVKTMFRELIRKSKFVFNKIFNIKEKDKREIVTAFVGLLEMSRRSKVKTYQDNLFSDIEVTKINNDMNLSSFDRC